MFHHQYARVLRLCSPASATGVAAPSAAVKKAAVVMGVHASDTICG